MTRRNFTMPLAGSAIGLYARGSLLSLIGAALGVWILLSSLVDPIDRWRRGLTLSRAVLGMTVAHMGLALAVIALTTVQSFTIERDVALAAGAKATVGDYEFRFDSVQPVEGPGEAPQDEHREPSHRHREGQQHPNRDVHIQRSRKTAISIVPGRLSRTSVRARSVIEA